jgi:hypothetical protein
MIQAVFPVQAKVNFPSIVEPVHSQESIYLMAGKTPLQKPGMCGTTLFNLSPFLTATQVALLSDFS